MLLQYQRNTLPIAAYRQFIVEMLDMSQVVVLSGETGWFVSFKYLYGHRFVILTRHAVVNRHSCQALF